MRGDVVEEPVSNTNDEAMQNTPQYEIDLSWNNSFTQEKLRDVWLDYGRSLESTNPRFASILVNHVATQKEGAMLELVLKNVTQQTEVNQQRSLLINYLRYHLKNANIQIEPKLNVEEGNETKAFTSSEKAKIMAEKNPALLELTKKFNLDVE